MLDRMIEKVYIKDEAEIRELIGDLSDALRAFKKGRADTEMNYLTYKTYSFLMSEVLKYEEQLKKIREVKYEHD